MLAKWAGFRKIGEKVVQHRPRKYGVSKFGWERFINGFLDLLTIQFVSRFGKEALKIPNIDMATPLEAFNIL